MQNHYFYWKATNMTWKNKKLKQKLLTEIRNYKQRYTIYMLVCNITGETYYGSTCQTLNRRMATHKCNRSCTSKIIINRGDYLPLIPLETNLSYSKKKSREDWYINNNICVNKMSAKFNVQNRKKNMVKWRANKINKEKNKKRCAKWNKNNKKYRNEYNYWRQTSPIGILARAYFD